MLGSGDYEFARDTAAAHELPADTDPTLTVLNWLRYHRRLTGTKEGCAEGDCGACTVVVSDLADGVVRHRAVNACILFAPMLDGRAITTVEGLGREGALSPVQQAMVDTHASQCGFCTPDRKSTRLNSSHRT